jgi:hypothetical protein
MLITPARISCAAKLSPGRFGAGCATKSTVHLTRHAAATFRSLTRLLAGKAALNCEFGSFQFFARRRRITVFMTSEYLNTDVRRPKAADSSVSLLYMALTEKRAEEKERRIIRINLGLRR